MEPKPKPLPVGADLIQLVRGLFVITDPGRDQDDEDVLVMLNRAVRLGILECLGVVANLRPSQMRARLARGTLNILGLKDVPVGFGSGFEMLHDDGLAYEFRAGYLAGENEVVSGYQMIRSTFERAPKGGIVLTLISQLTDAAAVLRNEPELFCDKVRRVVIMGGVVAEGDVPKLDEQGRLIPDPEAQNHKFDLASTEYLYRELQNRGIPITVLSRHAAAAAKVTRAVYDEMADTGHPVGLRLHDAQLNAIEELWRRANLPGDHVSRLGLPARCDRAWFCKAFCGGEGQEVAADGSIWPFVKTFMLYDPCTLLAAMPGLREYFFSPYVYEYNGVENFVIGVNAARHNVARPAELSGYLLNALVSSLQMSQSDAQYA
jgi:inosine-uridine nucleoside N-ribohydrolase